MDSMHKIVHLIEVLTTKRIHEKSLTKWFALGNTIIKLKNTLITLKMK